MKQVLVILLIISSANLFSEKINIGVFSARRIKKVRVEIVKGGYSIYTQSGKLHNNLLLSSYIDVEVINDSLSLTYNGITTKGVTQFSFIALTPNSVFAIKPIFPLIKERRYNDNLFIRLNKFYPQLLFVNNVALENYLAGVVESEVGRSPSAEYFNLQSVICRTYAKRNANRHFDEGYQLCDRTHCQAYNKLSNSKDILKAVKFTKHQVVIDNNADYIQATFFSNCGGQTQNSEDVWVKKIPYNKSVLDTFCLVKRNATWTKKIATQKWKKYLINKGLSKEIVNKKGGADFIQTTRKKFLTIDSQSVKLTEIRKSFRLKSTFFNAKEEGAFMILRGRGFGHGVGLCQEGAIRMASLNKPYKEVLNFYFNYISIADYRILDYYKSN